MSFNSPGNPNPHRGFNYLLSDPGSLDPFSASVFFLASFNTDMINRAVPPDSPSQIQDVSISAAQAKFGAASLFSTLSNGEVIWPANDSKYLRPNGTSFTFEGFIFPTAFGGILRTVLLMHVDFVGVDQFLQLSGTGVLTLNWRGIAITSVVPLTLNDWNYFAFSRPIAGPIRSYLALGGEVNATFRASNATVPVGSTLAPNSQLGMMREWSTDLRPFAGFCDEFRLTASLTAECGRYTSGVSIPVPTEAFPYP